MISSATLAAAFLLAASPAPQERHRFADLADRPLRVAFPLSEGATLIDFAGPWEVFQDVMIDRAGNPVVDRAQLDAGARHPYALYTVTFVPGARFVEAGPVASSAGLSAGIDLALRVVERHLGREVAQGTATFMEYQGDGWKQPPGPPLAPPAGATP